MVCPPRMRRSSCRYVSHSHCASEIITSMIGHPFCSLSLSNSCHFLILIFSALNVLNGEPFHFKFEAHEHTHTHFEYSVYKQNSVEQGTNESTFHSFINRRVYLQKKKIYHGEMSYFIKFSSNMIFSSQATSIKTPTF